MPAEGETTMGAGPRLRAPRGAVDLLPEEVLRFRALEAAAHDLFERYGYREVRTPLIEHTPLFVRSIGEVTDIVEKEMYTFGDGDDSVTLRPEGTASAVRAYLEHGYHRQARFQKWYYVGAMFRRERPQAGRQRQFHQIGVEVLGSSDPLLDVEVMTLACRFFDAIGLTGYALNVNTIGCQACRGNYRDALKIELAAILPGFCPDCKRRYERNVFRILDCKETQCRQLISTIPRMSDYLCAGCQTHWQAVMDGLRASGLKVTFDSTLVRGFDYYTRTVFEVKHSSLGARDAICGGGRYDNLIADLGGPDLGALGFAVGTEATLLAAARAGLEVGGAALPSPAAYVVAITPADRPTAYGLVSALREAGYAAEMDHEDRSPRAQMRQANTRGARLTVILGPEEAQKGTVKIKRMSSGEETTVAQSDLVAAVARFLAADGTNARP